MRTAVFFQLVVYLACAGPAARQSITKYTSRPSTYTVKVETKVKLTLASEIPSNRPAGPVVGEGRGSRWRHVDCGRVCWAVGAAVGVAKKRQQVGVEAALLQ